MAVPTLAIGEKMTASRAAPIVDGEVDAIWKKADRQRLGYTTGGENTRAAASAAYVSVLWDDDALYFLFELIDDDFIFDFPAGSEKNDSVFLYIDEEGYFGPTSEGNQTVISLTPALGKSLYPMSGPAPKDYEMGFGWDEDGHGIIEFKYVPHTIDLTKADSVLMDFQFNDAASDGTIACVHNWSDMIGEAPYDSSSWTYVKLRHSGGGSDSGYETAEEAAESIGRTAITRYTFRDGTDGNRGEGPRNLWDGNVGSKYCTSSFPMRSVARISKESIVDGIIMATANDNDPFNGRNPNDWKIEGSLDGDNWELILSGDESFFDEVNFTYFAVPVEDCGPYRFFRFSNKSAKSGTCQISEVLICSTDEAIKLAEKNSDEEVVIDKSAFVNYESMEREIARMAQAAEESAVTDSAADNTAQDPAKNTNPVPGIIVSGVLVVALIAAAVVVRTKKED